MFILQAGAAEARQLEKLMTDYGKQEVLLQRLKDQEQEVQVTIIRIRIDSPPFSSVPDPPPIHPYVYSPLPISLYTRPFPPLDTPPGPFLTALGFNRLVLPVLRT